MMFPQLAVALLLASAPEKVESIQATDLQGKTVHFQTAGKVTAVLFFSTTCPVSNDYNDRMKAIAADYQNKGVQVIMLDANVNEQAQDVAKFASGATWSFSVYKDMQNVEADRFGAAFTPHVFIVGRDSQVIYRGGIDDARNAARVTKNYLRDALDAALAGKPVPVAETKAFGCTIKRVRKQS